MGTVVLGGSVGLSGPAAAHDGRYRDRYYAPPARVVIVQPRRTIIAPYPPPYGVVYERPRWQHRQRYEQVIDRPYYYGYAPQSYGHGWSHRGRHW
jgi:hypothetical protein